MPTASWRRGGVVTQRIANPCTPVRFRPSPPLPFKHLRATFVCAAYWCVCNPVRIVHAVLPSDRRCSPRPILGPGKRPHPARSSQQVAGPRRRGARGALPGPIARRREPQGKGGGQLHRRLRIGTRRPWTVRKARRPPAGPAQPDRHGSIGLGFPGPGIRVDGQGRRYCTPFRLCRPDRNGIGSGRAPRV